MDILSDVSLLKGVGEKTKYELNDAGVFTIKDLIFNLPKNYKVYQNLNLVDIVDNEKVIINGIIESFVVTKYNFKSEMVIIYLNAQNRKIKSVFFNQGFLKYQIRKGLLVSIVGTYYKKKDEIIGSKLLKGVKDFYVDLNYNYKDLKSSVISKLVLNAYDGFDFNIQDRLPQYLKNKYRLLDYSSYLFISHNPKNIQDIKEINRRRKYESFLNYALSLKLLEYNVEKKAKSKRIVDKAKLNDFISSLPYKLTLDQNKAIEDIYKDIISDHILNRLVEGDVGSGKTIIASCAIYMTLLSSRQGLLMAPTELLAKQHYQKLKDLFDKYGFKTCLLTSDISKKEKERIIEKIRLNEFDLVISTQAILYQKNIFNNLGIIVIDEQHRFGVKQRSQLLSDYNDCDALYLTATPIPRTLGLSQIGDLKLSEVHTKPSGRKDIKTFVIDYQDLNSLKSKINDEINLGHQIFVIANKIDEDDNKYDLSKAFSLFKELAPNARIEKINGRLKEETKNKIMTSFLNKEFDILVSTTVIEVGIDIKDATMMFILNSENFGLATLHQLRGRVGRNDLDSYCYLVTDDTLNERLNVLANTNDCFEISEADFRLRGPGDFLGEEQSGFLGLDFTKDFKIYECAVADAIDLIENHKEEKIIEDILKELELKKFNLN